LSRGPKSRRDPLAAFIERWDRFFGDLQVRIERYLGFPKPDKRRTSGAILVLSILFHVILIGVIADQLTPVYQLPAELPPMQAEIVPELPEEQPPLPPPPPPPKVEPPKVERQVESPPPKPTPPKPQPQPPKPTQQPAPPAPPAPAPPAPTPPAPTPPKPAPPKPEPPKPAPPKPSPLPAPVAPTPAKPTPAPAAQPTAAPPRPNPAPTTAISPAPPTPQAGPPKPAPSVSLSPSPLNIHKPAQNAPSSVPSLPMAPAGGQPGRPGSAAAGGAPGAPGSPGFPGAPGAPGSRLNGLNPFPGGAMPGGGGGLRGTLVGCANADAVKLSGAERNNCAERFGTHVGAAPVITGISPAKRQEYDNAAARQERDRKYRDSAPVGTTTNGQDAGMGAGLGPQH
jgi:hypothetical protein